MVANPVDAFRDRHHPLYRERRGVLLLVVISMLTLFLLLGTTYLVVAARARQAARAQARLAIESAATGVAPARLLDAVLLKVVRGGGGPVRVPDELRTAVPATTITGTFESLLADKYGSTVTGTVVRVSQTSIPSSIVQVTVATDPAPGLVATDLSGRVLTILGPGYEPTSLRVLSGSASGPGTFVVFAAKPTGRRAFPVFSPGAIAFPALINGLEFDGVDGTDPDEPYDAFDDANCFLTQIVPKDASSGLGATEQTVAGSVLRKLGFVMSGTATSVLATATTTSPTGFPLGADNDNDGTFDGVFLDFGLPSLPAPDGSGTVQFEASVLVVDLDSRFNVNAHGSLRPLAYPVDCPGWPASADAPKPAELPIGSGYGPPEVNAGWMFPTASFQTGTSRRMRTPRDEEMVPSDDTPSAAYIFSGADPSTQAIQRRPTTSRFTPGRPLPSLAGMEGKYAEGEVPSRFVVNSTDLPAQQATNGWNRLNSPTFPLARPGSPNTNDLLSLMRESLLTPTGSNSISGTSLGVPSVWWTGTAGTGIQRNSYNSPPDLHGTMVTTTATAADVVPRMIVAKPDWGSGEATDDPYELRLDPKAARNGGLVTAGTTWDNAFGYADLEGLLRQYDIDGQHLSKRLTTLLGPASEEARLRVTTDSWDTTLITGSAARTIRTRLKNATGAVTGTTSLTGIVANEVARGERLNLNRPLTSVKPAAYSPTAQYYVQRQALFKDLYTLAFLLSGTAPPPPPGFADEVAQWAANVVEFCDADSTMTPFEYDTNPLNGWDVDNDASKGDGDQDRKVVWGAERPEILIAETSAWENSTTGEFYASLHRPWESWALGSGTNRIPAEPVDAELDVIDSGTATNRLDLGKKSEKKAFSDTATYPIWRLRIVDNATKATSYVRFDTSTGVSGERTEFAPPGVTSAGLTPRMEAGSWLCVTGGTLTPAIESLPPLPVTSPSVVRVPGGPPPNDQFRNATVFLERLSDPTAAVTKAIWDQDPESASTVPMYRVVDSADVQVVNRTAANPPPPTITTRSPVTFWRREFNPAQAADYAFSAAHLTTGGSAAWFPWPNRPLISPVELFLVPKRSAIDMLTSYAKPTASSNDLLTLNVPALLDAIHVPTRFAGIHTTINASGTATLAQYGIHPEITPVNQLSSCREPGRVNLNTITADDVWNAVVAGSLQQSGSASPVAARSGSGTAANFNQTPAKAMINLLSISGSGTAPIKDTDADLTKIQPRNPVHELYTATRLANTATPRSNVFAIWITVRQSVAGDPDSIRLHRGFYIVDRSIPVAHEPGKDHNVWDCVVLRRIIE